MRFIGHHQLAFLAAFSSGLFELQIKMETNRADSALLSPCWRFLVNMSLDKPLQTVPPVVQMLTRHNACIHLALLLAYRSACLQRISSEFLDSAADYSDISPTGLDLVVSSLMERHLEHASSGRRDHSFLRLIPFMPQSFTLVPSHVATHCEPERANRTNVSWRYICDVVVSLDDARGNWILHHLALKGILVKGDRFMDQGNDLIMDLIDSFLDTSIFSVHRNQARSGDCFSVINMLRRAGALLLACTLSKEVFSVLTRQLQSNNGKWSDTGTGMVSFNVVDELIKDCEQTVSDPALQVVFQDMMHQIEMYFEMQLVTSLSNC